MNVFPSSYKLQQLAFMPSVLILTKVLTWAEPSTSIHMGKNTCFEHGKVKYVCTVVIFDEELNI